MDPERIDVDFANRYSQSKFSKKSKMIGTMSTAKIEEYYSKDYF